MTCGPGFWMTHILVAFFLLVLGVLNLVFGASHKNGWKLALFCEMCQTLFGLKESRHTEGRIRPVRRQEVYLLRIIMCGENKDPPPHKMQPFSIALRKCVVHLP